MAKKREMTPVQSTAIAKVHAANLARRDLAARIDAEQREAKVRRLRAAELTEAIAVREAVGTGVIQERIKEALGTTDPAAVRKVLAKLDSTTEAESYSPHFQWTDNLRQIIAVEYPGFPTTSIDESYPEILSGSVRREETAPNGFEVLSDDSDEVTQFGVVPGHLRWEIEHAPTLPDLLNAWIEGNS